MENPELEQLMGDDVTHTEPAHFAEFASVELHAAELEGNAPVASLAVNQLGGTAPEPEIPTSELIAPIIGLACNFICPAWEIAAEEQGALAQSYADVIDKYFPGGAGTFGIELSALLITGAIIAPRLKKPRKHEDKPTKELSEQTAEEVKADA
ncbi:hypothetical protein [Shewanella sp. YLB-07]|uniref:hypothetical protein n=1 Tax=Shewanella sp. YLB-07 TaxID=2601268 RepID=UPI00128D3B3A|nr:hypothetical protein [Shewanella sp. YLB-07]MPY23914.1 hypothetical protein [Shewanella sp. YLB-07]